MDRFQTLLHSPLPEGPVDNPDAILFRRVFGQPKYASDLLRHQLPPDLVAAIDWSSLRPLDLSFVPERHRRDQVDIWFAARIGGCDGAVLMLCDRADGWPAAEPAVQHYLDGFAAQWRARGAEGDDSEPPPVLPYVMRLPPLPATSR